MPQQRAVELQFPLAGINRQFAYQSQPPFTTPDALNVRPWDPILQRERGGSRVGVERYLRGDFGSTMRALDALRFHRTDGFTVFSDDFSQGLSSDWTAEFGTTLPTVTDGVATCANGATVTAVHSAMSFTYSTTMPAEGVTVEALILPDAGKYQGTYRLFLYLDDDDPDKAQECFELELTTSNGTALTGHIRCMQGSSQQWIQTFSWTPTVVDAGWLRLSHLPGTFPSPTAGYVLATFRGRTLKYYETAVNPPTTSPTNNAHRWGFEMAINQGGTGKIERVRFHYPHDDNQRSWRQAVVGIASGDVYMERDHYEIEQAVYEECAGVNPDVYLTTAPLQQKVFIADHGNLALNINEEAPSDASTRGGYVESSAADHYLYLKYCSTPGAWVTWSSFFGSEDKTDYAVTLLTGPSGFSSYLGSYRVASVDGTGKKLKLYRTSTGNWGDGGCTFYLGRSAKVARYVHGTATDEAADNLHNRLRVTPWGCDDSPSTSVYPLYLPVGFSIVSKYGDRMVVAGDPQAPYTVYFSKQGDHDDFDTSSTDDEAAVAISLYGLGNLEVTALAPFSDDYLIVGCPTSLWVLRGDPRFDASFSNLAQNVGIVGPEAWTWLPDGRLLFLSHAGLYELAPGAGQYPRVLSLDRLPAELRGISKDTDRVALAYDPVEEGVLITVSPIDYAATTVTHWWYDPRREAFWRDELPRNIDPVCPLRGAFSKVSPPALLYGGRDGYVYHRAQQRLSDADTAISTNVLYGPLRVGGSPVNDGIISQLDARLGTNSDDVTWAIQRGDTAQAAVSASSFATGTFSAGDNYVAHPRARAHAACIKLSTTSSKQWAIENLTAIVAPGGRHRKA